LTVGSKVAGEIDDTIRRLQALRQSVLRMAFNGRLVDQDPTDEPASALLDRIRTERAKAAPSPATPRRRGRPRKAVKK
jgi:type I restriction enzyme S subunit